MLIKEADRAGGRPRSRREVTVAWRVQGLNHHVLKRDGVYRCGRDARRQDEQARPGTTSQKPTVSAALECLCSSIEYDDPGEENTGARLGRGTGGRRVGIPLAHHTEIGAKVRSSSYSGRLRRHCRLPRAAWESFAQRRRLIDSSLALDEQRKTQNRITWK